MADLTLTAANIALLDPEIAEVYPYIAAATITRGQSVYINSSGKADLCDANAAGKEQFRGTALEKAAAGQVVSVLKRGRLAGFDLSGLAFDAIVYQSDTAGAFADAASGTKTIRVGRVVAMSSVDSTGALQKALYIQADYLNNW